MSQDTTCTSTLQVQNSRSWNIETVELVCSGYIRKSLSNISIKDISLLISKFIADFKLNFINNEDFSHVYFDDSKHVLKKPGFTWNCNRIICEFNNYIENAARNFSSVVFLPFVSQLRPIFQDPDNKNANANCIKFCVTFKHFDSGYGWFHKKGYNFEVGIIGIEKKKCYN